MLTVEGIFKILNMKLLLFILLLLRERQNGNHIKCSLVPNNLVHW